MATPNEQFVRDTLGNTYDPIEKMIRFKTGPIEGMPGKALRGDGSVVNTGPRILKKKERRKNREAQKTSAAGYNFRCGGCNAITFHYESTMKILVEGYEERQEVETYECCICHAHYPKEQIDKMVAASVKQDALKKLPKLPFKYEVRSMTSAVIFDAEGKRVLERTYEAHEGADHVQMIHTDCKAVIDQLTGRVKAALEIIE